MRYFAVFLASIAMGAGLASVLWAQEEAPGLSVEELEGPRLVSRTWEQEPLSRVLKEISDLAGLNIIADPELETETITLQVKDLFWEDTLQLVVDRIEGRYEYVETNLLRVYHVPRITMSFDETPIRQAITRLADIASANIIISEDVTGTVTIHVRDVPWKEALEAIVKTVGYTLVEEKFGIFRVVDPKTLQAQMEHDMIKLQYLRPPRRYIAKIEQGEFFVGAPTATEDPVGEFTLLSALQTMLTYDQANGLYLGKINYDLQTHTIMINDTRPVINRIMDIVKRLDVEPPQVMIDVRFVNTSNVDLYNLGVSYSDGTNSGITFTTVPDPTQRLKRWPFGFGQSHKQDDPIKQQFFQFNYNVTATLRLFRQDTRSTVSQIPTIVTRDGHDATIFVGEEIHFAEVAVQSDQSGGTTTGLAEAGTSPVIFGFQLLVIPHINMQDNKVLLTLIPNETSPATGTTSEIPGLNRFTGGGSEILLPQIIKRTVVTHMVVESGQTVVVGGLIQDSESTSKDMIPFLSDIPILGDFLFTQTTDNVTKQHLLIFITPTIVRSSQDTRELAKAREAARRQLRQDEFDKIRQQVQQEELERWLKWRRERERGELDQLREPD